MFFFFFFFLLFICFFDILSAMIPRGSWWDVDCGPNEGRSPRESASSITRTDIVSSALRAPSLG